MCESGLVVIIEQDESCMRQCVKASVCESESSKSRTLLNRRSSSSPGLFQNAQVNSSVLHQE